MFGLLLKLGDIKRTGRCSLTTTGASSVARWGLNLGCNGLVSALRMVLQRRSLWYACFLYKALSHERRQVLSLGKRALPGGALRLGHPGLYRKRSGRLVRHHHGAHHRSRYRSSRCCVELSSSSFGSKWLVELLVVIVDMKLRRV